MVPIDRNPFLTFFLQLLEHPFSDTEDHFIYCILEDTVSRLEDLSPKEICEDVGKLPDIQKDPKYLELLQLKVARLIHDPSIVILDEKISSILSSACTRTLTLKENEQLRMEQRLSDYPLSSMIPPEGLTDLIEINQFSALHIVPHLFQCESSPLYQQALLNTRVTINSLEVVHHVLVNHGVPVPADFIHYYISHSIQSCEQCSNKDRQVKQVARFIQSLLEKDLIQMKEYYIEIQSFCLSFIKLKAVANLFRLASQEAQQQQQQK
ncbi:uncharacterized protein EV154DRAFT_517194 [Mucor mucedo]|uniref:uncharacterized protein n=1 Tax=Mucor mucedo TaxID=29922 RepID=UPI002220D886|nr:uncharacterized protein EV154DRAFT_517194 [Mucor mucedo]KAI7888608.1 hypothetical protein EV154DRAFT_517194 [Mucor mucedo]